MLTAEPPRLEATVPEGPVPEPELVIREARRRRRKRRALCVLALCTVAGLVAGSIVAAGSTVPPAGRPGHASGRQGPGSYAVTSAAHRVSVPFGSAAECPATPTATTFSATGDGAFTSCLRVGAVPAGRYHVVVTGNLTVPRVPLHAGAVPRATRVHVTIEPTSGGPGTRVTVTGTVGVPGRATTTSTTTLGSVCWDGCAGGLQYETTKHWTSPTTFVEHFEVPAAPWVVASRSGKYRIAPLSSGRYEVGVDCVDLSKGCDGQSQGAAAFHLVVRPDARRHGCASPTPSSCVYLQLDRGSALPGGAVRVRGFAPLTSSLLSLELVRGSAKGPAVAFSRAPKGGSTLRDGQADLDVRPAPTFSSLGKLDVLGEQADGPTPVSANPDAPARVAWCGRGAIGFAGATGEPTGTVPTTAVVAALAGAGFSDGLTREGAVVCDDVALPRTGTAVLAAFSVATVPTRTLDALVALETTDGGESWTLVTPPAGARATGFGGFRYDDGNVVALYAPSLAARPPAGSAAKPGPALAETLDTASGAWTSTALQCPQGAPCTTLGTALPTNCAMTDMVQAVLFSADGGKRWETPGWPSNVNACGAAEIAATGAGTELLADASSPYPLVQSTDGGRTWSDVALPKLPFTAGGEGPGITVLPDGGLLAVGHGEVAGWELLPPGGTRWCAVASIPATVREAVGTSSLTLDGTAMWWVSTGAGGEGPASLGRVAVSSLHC